MARWTDLAAWIGPTRNSGDGDGTPGEPADRMAEYRGLVVHLAAGSYDGTIAWEKNPSAQVSSHFVTARDGRCAQVVDTDDQSWCQRTGNAGWLSVENEGFLPQTLTAQQRDVIAALLARTHRVYGVPLQLATSPTGRGLGYHSMGGPAWGHIACPGPAIIAQLPGIVERAKRLVAATLDVEEVEDAMFLVRYNGAPEVFLSDGVTARWVRSEAELADVGTLIRENLINAATPARDYDVIAGVRVRRVGRRELIGRIAGPRSPGWEGYAA
jgi:hypothetical protein